MRLQVFIKLNIDIQTFQKKFVTEQNRINLVFLRDNFSILFKNGLFEDFWEDFQINLIEIKDVKELNEEFDICYDFQISNYEDAIFIIKLLENYSSIQKIKGKWSNDRLTETHDTIDLDGNLIP